MSNIDEKVSILADALADLEDKVNKLFYEVGNLRTVQPPVKKSFFKRWKESFWRFLINKL